MCSASLHNSPRDLQIFFLGKYLKDRVYANKLHIIEELKNNIRTEIRAISGEILRVVVNGMFEKTQEFVSRGGGFFSDIIFRR